MKRFSLMALAAIPALGGIALFLFHTGPEATGKTAGPDSSIVWTLDSAAIKQATGQPGSSGLDELPDGVVHGLDFHREVPAVGSLLALELPGERFLEVQVTRHQDHANGDTSIESRPTGQGLDVPTTLTWGREGMFGRIHTDDGTYLVHSDATGHWLVDLNDERLDVDDFTGDTLGEPLPHDHDDDHHHNHDHSHENRSHTGPAQLQADPAGQGSPTQIDVMFVYTPDMEQRYPGSLLSTRLNHLVAIANQAMVDSDIDIVVRLVHHRRVDYTASTNNFDAIVDLRRALQGQLVSGLEGLASVRSHYGADIVAFTWPHDIETRGSCGLAYFPDDSNGSLDPSAGVHIDNDGVSNWSICSDMVFTHELGHNLNARHQREEGNPAGYNYGHVRDGRYHTVMGSFGSADVNRHLRLGVFSNPDIQCAGEPCGSMAPGQQANNARTLGEFAPEIAGYQQPSIPGTAERPEPSNPDSDGDGVSDWDDPYPFDPYDGQEPETGPPPPFTPRQIRAGESEADFELLVVSSGTDQVLSFDPDGRFRGVAVAPEADDPTPVLTEYSGLALDSTGLVYLLASADVRRYDRTTGRLVDVFLDSSQPEPAELLSAFPRGLGFGPSGDLFVLGDFALERFDSQGNRLTPSTGTQQSNPDHWDEFMKLPLRALAFTPGGDLLLAEALDNRIMRFDGTSGNRKSDLAGPNLDAVVDPWDLAMEPDGRLLVANGRANNVLEFNIQTGQYKGEFVPAGAGGLSFARALTFGPDGNLYVASRDTHSILVFDGQSGAFLDTRVETGAGGLTDPEQLAFAPTVKAVRPGYSGQYYDPDRSGEGWLVEVLDEKRAMVYWFTFPPLVGGQGLQQWMVGVGPIVDNRIVIDEFYFTRGPEFGPGFDPDQVQRMPWGRLEMEFESCRFARVHYEGPPAFGQGELDGTRLVGLAGQPCDGVIPRPPVPGAPGISGQWFDPSHDGEGWLLQEIAEGIVSMGWFTYDANGDQAWIMGLGELQGRTLEFDSLYIPVGTGFGDGFDADEVDRIPWGTATLEFHDCQSARLDYQSHLEGFGGGSLDPVRLTRPAGIDCTLPY